jgi:N4-gp56 family major capsid protein
VAYGPPGNTVQSAGLNHQAAFYYDRLGLEKLKPMLRFVQVCEPRALPKNSGRTIQWYRFTVANAKTAVAADGVIDTAVPLASNTASSTVEEYNDFTSSSQLLEDTDVAAFVEEMVDFESTRAAITVDTLARIEADSNSSAQVSPQGSYFGAIDARANVTRLKALNVLPASGQEWYGIIHPYLEYDIMSDNTAGGFIDVMKYANPSQILNGEIGKINGVRFMSTTNVGTSGSSPNVLYNAYIFGRQALLMVDLSGSSPQQIADPLNQRFQTFVTKGGPSAVDPAGTIGTYVAYRFVTAFKTAYTSNEAQYRYRIIQADASLV